MCYPFVSFLMACQARSSLLPSLVGKVSASSFGFAVPGSKPFICLVFARRS